MYTVKYRTFDQLLEDVSIDFGAYSLEGMIEPQQLIKVALRVNYDLGLRIHQQKEILLDIEKGKAKLPSDFYVLNFAYQCGSYEVKEWVPSGTHIEEKIIAPAADCVTTPPVTTTETVSTTTETTSEGTPEVTQTIEHPAVTETIEHPAVTETIEHPAVPAGFNSYSSDYTSNAIGSQVVYNSGRDEFLLVQAYSSPTVAWPVSATDGTEGNSITYSKEWRNFTHIPELGVFVAGTPGVVNFMGLFRDTDYSLITEITMVDANGSGAWYFSYDADNGCVWAMQQYSTARHIRVNITPTSLTAHSYTDVPSLGSHTNNSALIYKNGKLYRFSYASGGSTSQGFNTDVTVSPVPNGFPDGANIERYTNGNGIWYDAGYTYKPQPRGERPVAYDSESGLFWIRFDAASVGSYIFTWDPTDGSWDHIKNIGFNNYTDGSIIYDSYGKNIIYSDTTTTEVIDPVDGSSVATLNFLSADIAASSSNGNLLLARNNSDTGVLVSASYGEGTPAYTETVVITPAYTETVVITPAYTETVVVSPAVPGGTTSETVTTTTTTTSGVDELYQCQPEGTCLTQCGEYYQLIHKDKYETKIYKTFGSLPIKASSSLDRACPNTCNSSTPNAAEIVGGFLKTPFETGQVYLNYQGALEDENGQLMVLDHPMINEYYEYAIKQRILESMYFAGEDVVQKMNLVEQRLRAARNNALSIVNTPNFAELKKIWEVNRKAQYHKYVNMFKSYPVIQR